jgi:hypothetical protein
MAVIDHQKQAIESAHFENTKLGLKAFEKWLKKNKVSFDENTVIENTGIYHRLLWAFCDKIKLQIHIGNAAHIKFGPPMREFWHCQRQKIGPPMRIKLTL